MVGRGRDDVKIKSLIINVYNPLVWVYQSSLWLMVKLMFFLNEIRFFFLLILVIELQTGFH